MLTVVILGFKHSVMVFATSFIFIFNILGLVIQTIHR